MVPVAPELQRGLCLRAWRRCCAGVNANYATMNGIAFNSAQMQAQQNQLNAQQSAATTGAAICFCFD